MGRVRVCPVCATRNPAGNKACLKCGRSLVGVFPKDEADLPPPPPGPAPGGTEDPGATGSGVQPGSLVLVFPWGAKPIQGETLLGYDNPAFRTHIEELGEPGRHVSGAHASISCRDGRFFIRHLSETNGTYLDGIAISGEAELHDGQKISLSRQVDVTVRIR